MHAQKARELAQLEWVTPEYIRAHIEEARKGHWDNPVGMAIYRIEGQMPMPEMKNTDDRHRYVRGEFAEYIEH